MNTSDIISVGSRPLLPTTRRTYSQEPKDVLYAKLLGSLKADPNTLNPTYDPYLYEFPGDRTYARYRSGVSGHAST